MGDDVRYFAIIRGGDSAERPSGLARRTMTPQGRLDETLRRDLTWMRDSVIHEWERGQETGTRLVEISEAEATRLIRRFGREWRMPQG